MINWNESDLFEYLRSNVYPDLVKSKNQMSRWDCYSPTFGHRIELKCRKSHYNTLLLEKKKYDAMIEECKKHLDIPMYINSTPEGIFCFNLLEINPIFETNFLNPATSHFQNRNRISKEVTYLEINKSIKL